MTSDGALRPEVRILDRVTLKDGESVRARLSIAGLNFHVWGTVKNVKGTIKVFPDSISTNE